MGHGAHDVPHYNGNNICQELINVIKIMSFNVMPLIYCQSLLVACFACSTKREDSVSLTFATNIDLSVVSLWSLLAFATRTQLQYQSPFPMGSGKLRDGRCWP